MRTRQIARNGSLDLGRVDETVAEAAGISPVPIRLAEGNEKFGLKHIQNGHTKNIKKATGMEVDEFVLDVLNSFNVVKEGGKGRIIVSKQNGKAKVAILELERTGDHYTVITAGIRDKKALGKKKTLWSQTRKTDSQTSLDHIEDKAPSNILPQDSLEINLAALNTPEDIDRLLTEVTATIDPQIQKNRRGVRGNAVTQQAADGLNMRVDKLLKRRTGEAFNAEQALAAKAASVNGSAADQVAFLRALKVHSAIEAQVMGIRAESGRALQQFRILPKGNANISDQITALLDSKQGRNAANAAQALQDILKQNPDGFADAAVQMAKPSGFDMIYEIWINGLLSGVKTHVVNITSNTLVPLWTMSERAVAGGARAAVGGDGVALQEAAYMLKGMVGGYRDGFRLAAKALRTGEGSDVLQKIETAEHAAITAENLSGTLLGKGINKVSGGALERDGLMAKGVNLFGHTMRLSGRFLMAEDELFRAVGYRMELNAQAMRTATDEGLRGEDLARRMEDIISDPPELLHRLAVENSRYQTFTKELGETGKLVQSLANRVPGGRVVAPFIRTPTNIIKFFAERTPLALAHPAIRADIMAGGARRDLAVAKIGLGSMVMATVADLTLEGHITGNGPVDRRQRALWLGMGNQPYSVKLGDTWYSYNRLEPLGMLLGVASDSAEILSQAHDADQASTDELAAAATLAIVRNISSKSYMQGVTNLVAAISDPHDASFTYYASSLAGSLVPSALRQANSDTVRRDTQGIVTEGGNRELETWQAIINNIKSRVPGYSEDLPPRLNLWGEVIHYNEGLGPDFLSPVSTSEQKQDMVNEELLRLGAPIGMPSKIVDGIRLNPHEYAGYVELVGKEVVSNGKTLKQAIGSMMRRKDYRNAGKDQQIAVVRSITNAYRAAAREPLKEEFSELKSLVINRKMRELQGSQITAFKKAVGKLLELCWNFENQMV